MGVIGRIHSRLSSEAGFALAAVVVMIAVLSVLAITTIDLVSSEHSRTIDSRTRGTAFAAAEAGMQDYLAKLTDDKQYYFHHVHPAESTRRTAAGTFIDPQTTQCVEASTQAGTRTQTGVIWPGTAGTTWTYTSGKDNWCRLSTGYEYNLQVVPPSASNTNIRIIATGRKIGDTNRAYWRAIEQWTHFSLVSEFQMITASDYSAGSGATTEGKIYAGIDAAGVKHNITHSGTANANLYAEGTITGPSVLGPNAKKYTQTTSPSIRTQIKSPIVFANFQMAMDDLIRAADSGGVHLNSSGTVWRIVFSAAGTFTYAPCTANCTDPGGATQPTWGTASAPVAVPTNGSIYSDVTVVVSGVVDGRVTVATNNHLIVGGNITYETSGDDVLGLIAKNDVVVAKWGPDVLSWRAAVIAQNGKRYSYDNCGCKTSATHTGSTASFLSPSMSMFVTRLYLYDETLMYLPPPWFPTAEDAYSVAMFREVTP